MGSAADDFRHFFIEHYGFVRRCVRRFGVPEAYADDAAQEAFMVVYRRKADFEVRAPKPFLRGVAWRVCANVRRHLNLRAQRLTSQSVDAVKARDRSDQSVMRQERAQVVRRCLAGMDPARSEAFQLMVVEGLQATQVAHMLDTSTHTVYRHVRAAKAALAVAIAEYRDGEAAQ